MKKVTQFTIASFLLFTSITSNLSAASEIKMAPTTIATEVSVSPKADSLIARLNEISAMDKSNLKTSQRVELRKEVRSIRKSLREHRGGIYLSLGAVIIIILLLIILL